MYQQSKFSQKFLDQGVEGEYQEYFKGQILEISRYGLIECGTIVAIAGISNVISGLETFKLSPFRYFLKLFLLSMIMVSSVTHFKLS
jgi:hypothetical protein